MKKQLHRNTTHWEKQSQLENKRGVYGGQCDLTGDYTDQLVPINDVMCLNCVKKYRDRPFVKKGHIISKADLCRFCGTFYNLNSNFLTVELMVGRLTLKRYSILDRIYNQQEDRDKSTKKTQRQIQELEHKIQ